MGWTSDDSPKLGSGHFASVFRVTRKDDNLKAAVKIIKKPKDSKKKEKVLLEYKILKECRHKQVVQCHDAFETDDRLYLVMELMEGGELFDKIVDMGHFTEKQAADATLKLLDALKFMHDQGIAHRDLKPENMLMTTKELDAEVKITDFGLSKFFDEQSSIMKTPCGTPGYIAPEVLHMRGYDQQCDIWSLGVIVYILLCGFPPFYAENDAQLFEKIKRGDYRFLQPYWDPVSDSAKDFIRHMLVVDPKKRWTAKQLMDHEWLKASKANYDANETKGLGTDQAGKDLFTCKELPNSTTSMRKLKAAFLAAFAVVDTPRI